MQLVKLFTVSIFFFALASLVGCSSASGPEPVDLDKVLAITTDSLERFESQNPNATEDTAMDLFAKMLQDDISAANPALHAEPIVVTAAEDGSVRGYNDANNDGLQTEGEHELFKIEIDSENNRLIASAQEYVSEQRFSGMGFLAGMLIGSMLSRQRAAGVNPANKRATPQRSARTRSGSGSHTQGK